MQCNNNRCLFRMAAFSVAAFVLCFSLTGATNEKRNDLMPINRKYPIEALLDAVRRFPLKHRQRVTFEYVLLRGITDSP